MENGSGTTFRVERSLARLVSGDPAAKDELFEHAQNRLVILTQFMRRDFRRLAALEDTDDVLQQAAIRLCRSLEALQPVSAADFFRLAALQIRRELCDLARHHFGRHRSSGSVPRAVNQTDCEFAAVQVEDPDRDPTNLAEWSEFHQAVDRLPELERQAFELVWYHGLPQSEAASVMGVTDHQWRCCWLSARVRLRELVPGFFDSPHKKLPECPGKSAGT